MTNKKNKFFTFCCSMIPGAGEMYLGFYKMGISLMAIFGILITISGILNLPFLTFLMPVIWFYSFFHVHNLNALPDEEFYALEDDWLLHPEYHASSLDYWLKKYRKIIAGLLIFFGFSLLWKLFVTTMYDFFDFLSMSNELQRFFYRIGDMIPQSIIAIVIIFIGIRLIRDKKESLNQEHDTIIPSPPYLDIKEIKTETKE